MDATLGVEAAKAAHVPNLMNLGDQRPELQASVTFQAVVLMLAYRPREDGGRVRQEGLQSKFHSIRIGWLAAVALQSGIPINAVEVGRTRRGPPL